MVNRIEGPDVLQKASPLSEPGCRKPNPPDTQQPRIDDAVSLQKKPLSVRAYTRSGKINGEQDIPGMTDLRQLVVALLERQGVAWDAAMAGEPVKIDDEARAKAQALISDDGYWGVEQTAERIFSSAVAGAGNDAGRINQIKTAISKGFDMAKEALGGTLPEISEKTVNAVMTKLDKWATNV